MSTHPSHTPARGFAQGWPSWRRTRRRQPGCHARPAAARQCGQQCRTSGYESGRGLESWVCVGLHKRNGLHKGLRKGVASAMAGDRASRARVAAPPPENACFAPTRVQRLFVFVSLCPAWFLRFRLWATRVCLRCLCFRFVCVSLVLSLKTSRIIART